MLAVLSQERDVGKPGKPVVVIDHHGVRRSVPESQKLFENGPDAFHIRGDLFFGQNLA